MLILKFPEKNRLNNWRNQSYTPLAEIVSKNVTVNLWYPPEYISPRAIIRNQSSYNLSEIFHRRVVLVGYKHSSSLSNSMLSIKIYGKINSSPLNKIIKKKTKN